ncbi:MAG: PDDEXK nuclease domain-containing protein [Bacteroidaceae bacterium]|nr:PDDEXK nuclease domain-containing protein [Bacteroidaceae bacterium]
MDEVTADLRKAVKAIKTAILQSQYRAAKGVNREQLSLYFGIGMYVSEHSRKGFWGTGAIESISEQLQKELPGLRGFGVASIKNMRQFYESWAPYFHSEASKLALANDSDSLTTGSELQEDCIKVDWSNRYPSVSEFDGFVEIGFTHHMIILRQAKTIEERLFYIRHTHKNQWNKYRLSEMLKADLYHHQGELPNNFAKTMPDTRTALQAIETFKDEYLLDFINVEEIGERDKGDIDEREVEKAIVHNVKNFIMTFGRDFTFVGNQYHLEKYGHEAYPDLLFYNRELAALVVVELKRGEFKPAYLGQLSAYLRILDSEVKKPFENPSVGIILCKQADKNFVEFLIQGYDNPMGVATYKTADDVRKVLPTEEELRRVMDEPGISHE